MRVLITGGAGFIGSALIEHLNSIGIDDIIVVDHLGKSEKWRNLLGLKYDIYFEKTEVVEYMASGNLTSLNIDAVIHLGACSDTCEKDASYLVHNNFEDACRWGSYCHRHGIKFINASSAATYGDGSQGFSEEIPLINLKPLNMYGYSKHMADMYFERNHKNCTILKFFNVFGNREEHKGKMRSFISKSFCDLVNGLSMEVFRIGGRSSRDFIYIDDVVKIITHFLHHDCHGIYNVGTGIATDWMELANTIRLVVKLSDYITTKDFPTELVGNYQFHTCADTTKLRAAGYTEPFTPLKDAVEQYYQKWSKGI